MMYECVVILKANATEADVNSIKEIVTAVVKEGNGEVLISDNWGVKTFAEPTSRNQKRGNYLYLLFKSNGLSNVEIDRRLGINEAVLRNLIVNVGDDSVEKELLKNYQNPFNKKPIEDDEMRSFDVEKDRRMFSKRRNCWFTANKIKPDWKDPNSYSWLISEFGKISPSRVSGLTAHMQRLATAAIKRGRQMGLVGSLSNNTAH